MEFAQYTDEWVEDSVLMSALSDSGCDCCSMAALPLSLTSLIDQCTDVDTDSREAESLPSSSTWPLPIRESIWKDRLLFRQLLKQQTAHLLPTTSSPAFLPFVAAVDVAVLQSLFSFSVPFLHQSLRSSFAFSPSFFSLLHALLTQLQRFPATLYPAALDAATDAELSFARALHWDEDRERLTVDEPWVKEGLAARIREVGGKLLVRRRKVDGSDEGSERRVGERFRNDRRLLRLWIFRCGLERLIELFHYNSEEPQSPVE